MSIVFAIQIILRVFSDIVLYYSIKDNFLTISICSVVQINDLYCIMRGYLKYV